MINNTLWYGSIGGIYNLVQNPAANQNQSLFATHQQKKMAEAENNPPVNEDKAALLEAMSKIPFKHITSVEEANANFRHTVEEAMKEAGITLGEDETLELTMGAEGRVKVGGLRDDARANKLEDVLNKNTNTKLFHFTVKIPFFLNSDYSREGTDFNDMLDNRAALIAMKDTASKVVMERTGVSMDFSQLYRTESGKIAGYPKELSWIFESDYDISNPVVTTDKDAAALTILKYANSFLNAPGGYESIPNIGNLGAFSFTKSDFARLAIYG
ncbi:MAG: hypothetical protein LBU73_07710 [Helicobacteraceae bacterium]|jgi:hypothetical protein|nr:hypothetical protein [Helicobacteraceae bacterium]